MATREFDEAAIFNAARQIDSADDRRRYLQEACGDDDALRKRVEALLRAHRQKHTFLDPVTVEIRATIEAAIAGDGPGTQIGPYRLLESVGEGGMGTVFRAEQTEPIQRRVAVKVIKPGLDSGLILARFEAERQALALMDHPNIARVLDAGTTQTNRPYFVMELIDGVPITRFCDEHRLTLRERLELFIPVCQAVQHAHQKGIIHRDLKPSNVLVGTYDGKAVPKVIDFGIAKAIEVKLTDRTLSTAPNSVIGTPEYMSPEQAEPDQLDIDTRSDIYSLGVLLYELLTGSTPLGPARRSGAGLLDLLRRLREEEPPRPSTRVDTTAELPAVAANRGVEPRKLSGLVRGDLDWIVMKCLEKDRTRRYATANALARDVERYLNVEPVEACPPSRGYRLRKFARKNRNLLAAAGAFVLLLTAGAAVSTWLAVRATAAEKDALAARDGEAEQRQHAEARRKQAEQSAAESAAVLKFFRDRVLAAARPKGQDGGLGKDATIRAALDQAEPEIAKTFADQPLVEASIRHAMALSYSQLGELKLAIPQQERALALYRAHRGPEHRDTVGAINNLAVMFAQRGQPEEAGELFAEALELKKKILGPEDPDTLMTQTNLATTFWARGDLAEARKRFEEVLPILERVPGKDKANLLRATNNLAIVIHQQGDLPEARRWFEKTLKLEHETLPEDHPYILGTMLNLASVLDDLGELEQAHAMLQMTLDAQKKILPATHPDLLSTKNNLALLLHKEGKWAESLKLFEETLADQRKALRPGHPELLRTMNNVAWLLLTADEGVRDPQRAMKLVNEMTYFAAKAAPRWTTLGVAHYRAGDWKQAVAALEKYEPQETDRNLGLNGFFLAMAYWKLGDKDKARQCYDKAVGWTQQNLQSDPEYRRIKAEAAQVLGIPASPPWSGKAGK
jgi:serine/threonine protein kinase/tetratricopeptide (TPR) repeat protein